MSSVPIRTQKAPIRRRIVLAADGGREVGRSVYCPARQRTESLDTCAKCRHLWKLPSDVDAPGAMIDCLPRTDGAERASARKESDVREVATRTRIGDVMRREVVCARADADADVLDKVLVESGQRSIFVVDSDNKLIGVVSKSDLLGWTGSRRPAAQDVMTSHVHALPDDAPLAFAVSLMAVEELLDVPVVSHDGTVIGLVTAQEVLRWLAERLGYVFPDVQKTA